MKCLTVITVGYGHHMVHELTQVKLNNSLYMLKNIIRFPWHRIDSNKLSYAITYIPQLMPFLLAQAFLENSNRRYILPLMQCKKLLLLASLYKWYLLSLEIILLDKI